MTNWMKTLDVDNNIPYKQNMVYIVFSEVTDDLF